jgi:hypothetical protein
MFAPDSAVNIELDEERPAPAPSSTNYWTTGQ